MVLQVLCAMFVLVLTSCSLVPEFHLPDMRPADTWRNISSADNAERLSDIQWWNQFGSDELSGIIVRTSAGNNDLLAAEARIEMAQALARIAGAPLLPNLSGNANAARDFNSKPSAISPSAMNSYQAGLLVAYEADIFGKLRNAAQTAGLGFIASRYDRDALMLSTTAQAAIAYFNLLALNQRVSIAENNLKNAREILKVTQTKFDAGTLSGLELSQQRNLTETQEAAQATLRQQREVARNLLAVLLGESPEFFATRDNELEKLSPPLVATVLPAEVLTHRPDIASLEAQLRAANFNIGAARAAFFPSLNLNASAALSAIPASTPAAVLSSLAASITAPLFDGGQLRGGLENATARQKELAANYRKAVLTAFGEAENALSAVKTAQDRLESLAKAADEAMKAYQASLIRYNAGFFDYLTLLTTQNTLFQAQDALAQARADRLSASVELFKALGGGWQA